MSDPKSEAAHLDASFSQALRVMGLASFAAMASMRWCDAMLPALARDFSSTSGQAAGVVSAFALAYGVMQLVYGPLGDRIGKQRMVAIATLACTIGAVASALAPSLGWLTVARALSGATAAGIVPTTMAWIGDRVSYEHRQSVLARLLLATITGMIAGQWLGGVFADTLGWRVGFFGVATVFAMAGGALQWSLRRMAASTVAAAGSAAGATPSSYAATVRTVLGHAEARRLMFVAAVEGALAFGAVAFVPSHLHARFGLSMAAAGGVVALYGLGGLVYARSVGWLLRRLGQLPMARAGGLLLGTTWLLLAWIPDWRWAPPLCLAAGLGFYMLHNVLQTHATQVVPAARGTAVSMFASALFLGQSIGVTAMSWVVDHWSAAVALSFCGPGLMAVGLYFAAAGSGSAAGAGRPEAHRVDAPQSSADGTPPR
jgi:predicted MFS family arabinose efflux permease